MLHIYTDVCACVCVCVYCLTVPRLVGSSPRIIGYSRLNGPSYWDPLEESCLCTLAWFLVEACDGGVIARGAGQVGTFLMGTLM